MVEEGKPAPDFELESDEGETVTLSSLRGKPVVLYFYPKDNTSGCTTQACGIRDAWGEFERAGAVVLGVSPDGVASHASSRATSSCRSACSPIPTTRTAEDYGVWVEKTRYGRTYMGIRPLDVRDRRRTGTSSGRCYDVKPATHADEVLAILAA